MATDPTILADIQDVEAKLDTFTTSNSTLPGLKASVDQATSNYNAGVTQAATDKAALDASVAKLVADVATIESGGTPSAPPVTPPGGGGGDAPINKSRFAR